MPVFAVLAGALALLCGAAQALDLRETPALAEAVDRGSLPPVAERLPDAPLVVDMEAEGREFGRHGGRIRTLIGSAKDVRMAVVYGYARLVGYDEDFQLKPDILETVEVDEGRIFTLRLRPGHRWSDGAPFTTEDLRYWWEDVANHPALSPSGPPPAMLVGGRPPQVTVLSETAIRYAWHAPNARFLPALAGARPLFIYRPAHYAKEFHVDYADGELLAEKVARSSARNWAALHNRRDNLYDLDNPALPTLQPWRVVSEPNSQRFLLNRNPYYHRVDARGLQLPYVDEIEMTVAAGGLIPAKTNRGESDLQARGLSLSDAPVLRKGEAAGGYRMHLWVSGYAAETALYPNLTYADPVWRAVLRDVRFRRALSLGVSRKTLNKSLYFGLARPVGMTALPQSPFFEAEHAQAWAAYDPEAARALLDEAGLRMGENGVRLLPDGRPLQLVVETAGERREELDALELIAEMWAEIGVDLIYRPLDRNILRNRVYAGDAMMPVWFGWNTGVPTADAAPSELAPVDQSTFSWPAWGQHFQTNGEAGEPVDMPQPARLLALWRDWNAAPDDATRAAAWREMLAIHADQVFGIGLIASAPQPVVVSTRLRNLPREAVYAWEPGAHFGVHRTDALFYAE